MQPAQLAMPGESLCYYGHPHRVILAGPITLGVFFALPWLTNAAVSLLMEEGLKPAPSGFGTEVVLLGTAGLLWLISLLHYLATSFAVTTRRVMLRQGVMRRKQMNTALVDIQGIEIHQGIAGRFIGYGSVVVHGPGGKMERFAYVPDPVEFKQLVLEQRSRMLARSHQAAAA